MQVKVTKATPSILTIENKMFSPWYENSIGKTFDVECLTHPVFQEKQYRLLDTPHNRAHFKYDALQLLSLQTGMCGIKFNDAEEIKQKDA